MSSIFSLNEMFFRNFCHIKIGGEKLKSLVMLVIEL